jgi:hypothetical protein
LTGEKTHLLPQKKTRIREDTCLLNRWNMLITRSLELLCSRRNLLCGSREDGRVRVNHSERAAIAAACDGGSGGGGVVAPLGTTGNSILHLQLLVLKTS